MDEGKVYLLDEKGKLPRSFWAASEQCEYNRERVSRSRGREWELLQLSGGNYVFRLLFGHFGSLGLCRASFTDLKTGEHTVTGPIKLLSGDGYFLDYGVTEPRHLYRNEAGFFLSLDFDGAFYRFRCHAKKFDVELMMPRSGDTLVSAAPFDNPRRFFYAGRELFPELRGLVRFAGRDYSLKNAFVSLESCRAALPRKSARVYGSGCQEKNGHSLGLVFGWGFGYTGAGLENGVFLDGKLVKLNRVREARKGSFMTPGRFYTEDGTVDLRFTPKRDELFVKDYRLLYFRSHCTVGTLSGTVKLRGIGDMKLDNFPFLCEHSRFCF